MATSAAPAEHDFTDGHRCPICHAGCGGRLSPNGEWAYCARVAHDGPRPFAPFQDGHGHRLHGDCPCGQRHAPLPPPLPLLPPLPLPDHQTERDGEGAPCATVVLLADVRPERVDWLWPGRIPRGKLTVLDGDPGLGKSAVTLDLAARLSAGLPLPDGAPTEAAGVVLLSAEDGLADTIRPRLDAAGADPSRVLALVGVADEGGERPPALPADLAALEAAMHRVGAALAVVDPLMAYLGGEVNSRQDQDVRRALAPLAALAERSGAAVVVVRHLNKAPGGSPLYRGGGSIGIIGAARSGLLVAADPDDPERRVLASIKSNLGPPPPALAYRLEGTEAGAVRVAWLGESGHTAAALLAQPAGGEERDALAEAVEVLRYVLADGQVDADEAKRQARQAGVSERTLDRAKAALGVRARRIGFGAGGRWVWALPGAAPDCHRAPADP